MKMWLQTEIRFQCKHKQENKIEYWLPAIQTVSVIFELLTKMDFYSSAFPLHFMSKLSGLTIFTLNRKNFTTKITIFDFLMILLTITICYQLNINFWKSFSFNTYYLPNKIIKCYFPIVLYGKFLVNIISMIWTGVCRKKIAELFREIQEIDEMVKCLNESEKLLSNCQKSIFSWRTFIFTLTTKAFVGKSFCTSYRFSWSSFL